MYYSHNFEDNIPGISFNSTSKNILKWIQENRETIDFAKDPNAFEMVNLFLFGAKYSREGIKIDTDSLTQIWNIRSKDFERCNVSEYSFIYAICQDSYNAAISGKSMVNDENSHHALRKIAGIGLYLKQERRNTGDISYNNPQELLRLLECSSTLKSLHPDLFEKYAFQNNLDVLCKLQLSQELPPEISDSIRNAQHLVSTEREDVSPEKLPTNSKRYLCGKIIDDCQKVCAFLRKHNKEIDLQSKSEYQYQSPANSYYYSLYYEMSHARSDLVQEYISFEDFEKSFDSIYSRYDVDLDILLDALEKISDLERNPDYLDREELVNSLDHMALAHSVKRRQAMKENGSTADGRN